MLSLTRKADYAVMAMAELARRYPGRLSARGLAQALRVPLPVLTGVLHQLRQAELIGSMMGGRGGYALARDAGEISLADMVEAIEGPIRLALCCGDGEAADHGEATHCGLESDCRIKAPVQRVHQSLRMFLQQIRLRHLAFEHQPLPILMPGVSLNGERATSCGCGGSRGGATEDSMTVSSVGSE